MPDHRMSMPRPAEDGGSAGSSAATVAFHLDVLPERDVVRVVPVGVLDLAGAADVVRELQELRDAGFERIVLDLHRLQLLDVAAIEMIAGELRLARDIGREVVLVAGDPALQRALAGGGGPTSSSATWATGG